MSYGMVMCKFENDIPHYLMIRRIFSFGFIDFINSNYNSYNIIHIKSLINEMSFIEKKIILKFIDLCEDNHITQTQICENIYSIINSSIYNINFKLVENVFLKMRYNINYKLIVNGIKINNYEFTLRNLLLSSNNLWIEPEWEFPKGRKHNNESDLNCAVREFEEETGIHKKDFFIISNILPYEETFIGSNYKSYKQKYFVCITEQNIDDMTTYQTSEVSKMEWKTYENCISSIRPYNLEKKNIINKINKVMNEYRLYV
jgi:ADP-ribose pyrophosphatase YjhB (NUDIX family)